MQKLLVILTVAFFAPLAVAQTPLSELEQFSPALSRLINQYPELVPKLREYARSQDFTVPDEQLAVVAHELIHIASAAYDGYWVRGTIYEGYNRQYWQGIRAKDVKPTPGERDQMAPILDNYWERNPSNDLGNVVDEINAYGETAPFVCLYVPARVSRQIGPLVGHLTLLNAWLRTFRLNAPERYAELRNDRATRGIIELTVRQAWQTLAGCGVHQIAHQEEVQAFLH